MKLSSLSSAAIVLCAAIASLGLTGIPAMAHTAGDDAAIRKIVQEEADAWTRGDAVAYSRYFAQDGVFTNIRGELFTGYEAFLKRHEELFKGPYHGTTLHHDIVSLRFLRPDVAVVNVLTAVSGIQKFGPGLTPDAKGRLRTRLLQVLVKENGEWKIIDYHNVDVKAGTPVPEPQMVEAH